MADTDEKIETEQVIENQVPDGTTDGADSIDDGVAELQRKLEESERGRVAAERRADEASRRAGHAETSDYGSKMALISGALDTLNANRETLKREFSAAMAAGEFDRASDIQVRISDEAAQRLEVERGKAALEAQQVSRPQPGESGDPRIEGYVRQLQPRAAAWIRAHPQYVTDPSLNDQLLQHHYAARTAGHQDGTEAYFDFVEKGLGLKPVRQAAATAENPPADATSSASKAVQTRDVQPSPAAPSRGTTGRQVRLSAREREAAQISGLSDEEYAQIMERERKAGTIGKDRVH